jgi:hypothetical protein
LNMASAKVFSADATPLGTPDDSILSNVSIVSTVLSWTL